MSASAPFQYSQASAEAQRRRNPAIMGNSVPFGGYWGIWLAATVFRVVVAGERFSALRLLGPGLRGPDAGRGAAKDNTRLFKETLSASCRTEPLHMRRISKDEEILNGRDFV
ncbi:unnamed protein product [Diplocarpon coronariae]|uniref:Uncharacterized protein n=1 Tax=Diplocarpon coronariae TaxID=2795749 RepID=A0A218Z2Y6_9HELO|nr:hypothetical protein B2J93_2132 [Marssonina coronariae]